MPTLELHGSIFAGLPPETVKYGDIDLSLQAGLHSDRGRQFVRATLVRPNSSRDAIMAREAAAAEVDPLLLAATLAHGRPVRAEWGGGRLLDMAGATIFGISPAILAAAVRAPLQRLSVYAKTASLIAAHTELSTAISRWRDAFDYLRTAQPASMALTYLSVAVLVDHMRGDDKKSDWLSVGADIGVDRGDVGQLYDSLQFGRHVNPSRARGNLQAAGQASLSAHDCYFRAAEFIDAYRVRLT
jgi:hypothetical protein